MKILNEFPPNYAEIKKRININEEDLPVFTYSSTIFNPGNQKITPDLIIHEEVHQRQQGSEPEVWWDQYLTDIPFRLEQELMAYAIQFAFIKKNHSCKGQKYFLEKMAEYLSGPMYGGIITYHEAEARIRRMAKVS